MEITFDHVKVTANIAKHGVSLILAADLEWDNAMTWPDARRDYGEVRMIGLALSGTRLYCVILRNAATLAVSSACARPTNER